MTSGVRSPGSNRLYSDDWMLWQPGPTQSTPPLVRHSMETLLRVMRTWPKTLAKGFQVPPMLHFTHTRPDTILQPISSCIRLAKMWSDQSEGATEIIRDIIIQEMRILFDKARAFRSLDERHLLSALQALVMYTIIIIFPGHSQLSISLIDPAIFLCLQRVVSYVAKTGLMLTEENDNERPSWDSWVHVTAKRRAVFSLYLLHWSYSVYHGLQSFECSQLGFLPAPAPKFLWQAESREKWEDLYIRWLAQWKGYPFSMSEFAVIQSGTTLDRRTEMWLEDADELGLLFFSIGTTVHPCVIWW
ncbi:C6 finger domain-containing protein [Lojkania enalia]|uniref:C6 finger domain-containing protein n=1 Tax=Lojkania enalia TaxID=147567 RepID=A0A9P4KHK2_9PLEO|nr:C6 finger domain-containing protein [Didymosphaeria enalia]